MKNFHRIALDRLERRFGKTGLRVLAEEVREHLLLGEAALIVLNQAGAEYKKAQVRCVGSTTVGDLDEI